MIGEPVFGVIADPSLATILDEKDDDREGRDAVARPLAQRADQDHRREISTRDRFNSVGPKRAATDAIGNRNLCLGEEIDGRNCRSGDDQPLVLKIPDLHVAKPIAGAGNHIRGEREQKPLSDFSGPLFNGLGEPGTLLKFDPQAPQQHNRRRKFDNAVCAKRNQGKVARENAGADGYRGLDGHPCGRESFQPEGVANETNSCSIGIKGHHQLLGSGWPVVKESGDQPESVPESQGDEKPGMSSTPQLLAVETPVSFKGRGDRTGTANLRGADLRWAIAFVLPYAAVFFVFVVYPFGYALWTASKPSLYADLIADRLYLPALLNTLLFVGLGVNVKMFLALLLSGFFMRRRWWIKVLLSIFIVPWVIAAAQACVSFHWMLQQEGLVDGILSTLFGIDGPIWFNDRWLGIGWNIIAYIWKWMPFWTVIFLAARMRIPREIYDAAEVDGATGIRHFIHVTFPLLANLYLLCTLLSTLWTVGDFTTVYLVSGGGPAGATNVLATLGFHYAFDESKPALGVAAAMSSLPALIPIAIVLVRRVQTSEAHL